MRLILYFRCSGFRATTIWIVEQLGLAIILSSRVNASALSSGTTSFFVGSILHADELSITVMPAAANFGAHSSEVPPPAEKMAIAGFLLMASVALTTDHSLFKKKTFLPTDFSEATGISSVTGKFLSANTSSILVPTSPVAPTTATFIFFYDFTFKNQKAFPVRGRLYYFEYTKRQTPSRVQGFLVFIFVYVVITFIRTVKITFPFF